MNIDMVLPTLSSTREVTSNEGGEQGDFAANMVSLLALMPMASETAPDTTENQFQEESDSADMAAIPVPVNALELLAPTLPLQAAHDFLTAGEVDIAAQSEAVDNELLNPLFAAASGTLAQDTASEPLTSMAFQVQEAVSIVREERDNRLTLMLDNQRNVGAGKDIQPLSLAADESKERPLQFTMVDGIDEMLVSRDMPVADKMVDLFTGNVDSAMAKPALTPATVVSLPQTAGTPEWQKSLGQQIALFSREGIQYAELRLHPEELGAVQVSMRMSSERMQIHFMADNILAREALENALPSLRQSLAELGIGQSSVGADTNTPSSNASNGEKCADTQDGHRDADGSDVFDETEEQPVAKSLIHHRSGINTFV